jgi:hypothetical protein
VVDGGRLVVVDGGEFTVGLRRGDGEREREREREREGGKDLGGKWVLGTKNGYRRRRRTALFQNQIFASSFFIFFLKK